MEIATLAFAAFAAIGAVFVPFYLATPRLSLRFVGFDVLGWEDVPGATSVHLRLAVHNKGRTEINGLEVRAAFIGQSLADAQLVARFSPLAADQYEPLGFTPDRRARFELGEDPRLVTSLLIVAQWGGRARKTLRLSGSLMTLTKAHDRRPRRRLRRRRA